MSRLYMSIIEGEPFHCSMHGFVTESINEWNDHCFGNPEHLEAGKTSCRKCGIIIQYENLPFHKLNDKGAKNISLLCSDCESQIGNASIKIVRVE